MKYLLGDRKFGEYYFITCNSCFGGGICENVAHNDLLQSDYTSVVPSSELGTNYVFHYSDCANSPSWVCLGNELSDLYKYKQHPLVNEYEYKNQANNINSKVKTIRSANIQLLTGLLSDNYEFLKEIIDQTKVNWNQENY